MSDKTQFQGALPERSAFLDSSSDADGWMPGEENHTGKFRRRNRAILLTVGSLLLLLVVAIAVTTWGLVQATRARQMALLAEQQARAAQAQVAANAIADDAQGKKPEKGAANAQGEQRDLLLDLARTKNKLGTLLLEQGKRAEAQAEYEAARAIIRKLVEEFPAVPEHLQELARCHINLGNLLAGKGRKEAALAEYERARAILTKLLEVVVPKPADLLELARVFNSIGNLIGKEQAARENYERARAILKELVAKYPDVPAYRQELARTLDNVGNLIRDLGKREEAQTEYEAARAIRKKLAE